MGTGTGHQRSRLGGLRAFTASIGSARRAIFWVAVAGLLATMAALLLFVQRKPSWSPETVTWVALTATAFAVVVLWATPRAKVFGFVGVYGMYLALSHLGAAGAYAVSSDAFAGLHPWQVAWFFTPERPVAVALSGLAVGALVLGAMISWRLVPLKSACLDLTKNGWTGIYLIGLALLAAAAAYLTIGAATGRIPVFDAYSTFRQGARETPFYHEMIFGMAVGLVFVTATGDRWRRGLGLAVFSLPAVLIAVSGNRGLILFPVAAAVAVYCTRGYRVGPKAMIAGLLIFFVYIPLAAQWRKQGLGNTDFEATSLQWSSPLIINGWTLRPFVFTIGWIERGEPLALGGTYALPARRVVGLVTPLTRPDFEGHPHNLRGRLPRQGYSVIAEAYYNFGLLGILGILGGIGAFLAFLGDRARGSAALALAGVVMAILINHVRNFSSFVPGQLAGALVLWTSGLLLSALLIALRTKWEGSHQGRRVGRSAPWLPNPPPEGGWRSRAKP